MSFSYLPFDFYFSEHSRVFNHYFSLNSAELSFPPNILSLQRVSKWLNPAALTSLSWEPVSEHALQFRVKDSNTIVNRQKDSNTITTPRTSYTILMTSLSLHPIVAPFNLKPHC
jgi:hypothetical protein